MGPTGGRAGRAPLGIAVLAGMTGSMNSIPTREQQERADMQDAGQHQALRALRAVPLAVAVGQATRPQSPTLQMEERRRQVPFRPITEHRSTPPAPFSFETRDKQRQAGERKIRQVMEKECDQREFQALHRHPRSPNPPRRLAPRQATAIIWGVESCGQLLPLHTGEIKHFDQPPEVEIERLTTVTK